ncbi:hypothetical protein B0H14DRAFT_2767665 [Mycena olivaceomarginata]|nr:hypothetical protein B0H14DRAFT_2884909 [Mycena olivaceomarginata]KAJ7848658.1 hypothetical protein B0H14DRAFT_2767665 [Mycena olivaceomarginata]
MNERARLRAGLPWVRVEPWIATAVSLLAPRHRRWCVNRQVRCGDRWCSSPCGVDGARSHELPLRMQGLEDMCALWRVRARAPSYAAVCLPCESRRFLGRPVLCARGVARVSSRRGGRDVLRSWRAPAALHARPLASTSLALFRAWRGLLHDYQLAVQPGIPVRASLRRLPDRGHGDVAPSWSCPSCAARGERAPTALVETDPGARCPISGRGIATCHSHFGWHTSSASNARNGMDAPFQAAIHIGSAWRSLCQIPCLLPA